MNFVILLILLIVRKNIKEFLGKNLLLKNVLDCIKILNHLIGHVNMLKVEINIDFLQLIHTLDQMII